MEGSTRRQTRSQSSVTPEIAKRIEENQKRAKALQDRKNAGTQLRKTAASSKARPISPATTPGSSTTPAPLTSIAGTKRPRSVSGSLNPLDSNRDGTRQTPDGAPLRPAKKFAKYVEYNMSTMSDNKGGFLTTEDDPYNAALQPRVRPGDDTSGKPKNMTAREWERLQIIRDLERRKAGPFEPGISVIEEDVKRCRECDSREIDFVWEDVFKVCVCSPCKDKFPEKYSLLTKTECREDYLLTDEELKDADLLPHLNKPNPHKTHWHDMMLFLRFQVEDYAISQKWGSAEALDAEFEKREEQKKRRKEAKFKEKLRELKRKTRTDAFRRQVEGLAGPANFGDSLGGGKHVHTWGRTVENSDGMTVKKCLECGMEVEELEF
ncbi:DNA repair protein RAD14 [Ceratocystis lukuohia]|uniref:DNA repair protein RAD14 n=1 Tax=Ceratocystis lukuohia TaxID=2019550 RepID=A0ABR4MSK3_9PEZI